MKNNRLRIVLDVLLIVLISTLFSKNAISMAYHEIAGLVLFGLFVVHLILNRKWIAGVFLKIFSKKFPMKTRITCLIDLLLVISWTMTIVCGALISKVVFPFHLSNPWKQLHMFFAGLALILTGLHAGLHWTYLKNSLANLLVFPKKIGRGIAIAVMVAVLAFGVYTAVTGDLGQWLSAPFRTSQQAAGGPGASAPTMDSASTTASAATDTASATTESTTAATDSAATTESATAADSASTAAATGDTTSSGTGTASSGGGEAMHGGEQQGFSFTNLLRVMAETFSVMYLFMFISALLSGAFKKNNSKEISR